MSKYQGGKIYKIVADDTNKIYIGSTIQKLYKRFSKHKSDNISSKELFEYPNTRIELIENYLCNSKRELDEREQYYINLNKDICINKIKAYQTKEERKEQDRQYSIDNKDKYLERATKYYKDNKEHVLSNVKKYRLENIEKIKNQKREYIICDICNSKIRRHSKSSHIRTKKHLSFL